VYAGPSFHVRYRNGDEMAYVMTVFETRAHGRTPRLGGLETLDLGYFTRQQVATCSVSRWLPAVLTDAPERREREERVARWH